MLRVWGNDDSLSSSNFGGEIDFSLLLGGDYFFSRAGFFKGGVFSSDFCDAFQVVLEVSGVTHNESDWLFMKAVSRMVIES